MPDTEKRKIIAIIIMVSFFVGGSVLWQDSRQAPGKVMADIPESVREAQRRQQITVNITGAVANAGIYSLMPVARVEDVVEMAGGFLPEADKDKVNMAGKCSDGMRINIPYKKPEKVKNNRKTASKKTNNAIVNINTATEAELTAIPGIGPALAKRIIGYRSANGPFNTVEQLKDVSGIGESKFAALKGNIRI